MKKQLDYFMIAGEVGGNQDLFRDFMMNKGGCAAATCCDSCIYFAMRSKMAHLYPFDIRNISKEDYIQFAMRMKPYISPRVMGVNKLYMFTEGAEKYLRDVGDNQLEMREFSGTHSDAEAAQVIKQQIDAGYPVPYLMLKHRNPDYTDFVWHWFLCIGYEETEDDFLITVATYGESVTLSLTGLWDTGYEEKGGLILWAEKEN